MDDSFNFCAVRNVPLYNEVTGLLRDFFNKSSFYSVPTQSRLSILAACEDPKTVATFDYLDEIWPLPQTGQMWLEYELLTNPDSIAKGYYCESTSYRNEPNPTPGRHLRIFPMFEFESPGGVSKLMNIETDLVRHFGYDTPARISYQEGLEIVNKNSETGILDNTDEETLCKEHGPVVLLYNFPERTSPFWNMKRDPNNIEISCKVDVLMHGMETIGSAERSTDVDNMRNSFYTISDGEYANLLFNKFGKDRTVREFDEYLGYNLVPRCGGGIGLTRLMRSYEMLQNEGGNYNYNAGCTLS